MHQGKRPLGAHFSQSLPWSASAAFISVSSMPNQALDPLLSDAEVVGSPILFANGVVAPNRFLKARVCIR
jgi:hypothetical protein